MDNVQKLLAGHKAHLATLILLTSLLTAGTSYADCPDLDKLKVNVSDIRMPYDDISNDGYSVHKSIEVTNNGSYNCDNVIVKFLSNSGAYLSNSEYGSKLNIKLSDVTIGSDLESASTRNSYLTAARISPGESKYFSVPLKIIKEYYGGSYTLPPGEYTLVNPIKVAVVSADVDRGNSSPIGMHDLDIIAEVAKKLSINIGSSTSSFGSYSLNMGELVKGKSASVGFNVQSNINYKLRLKSDKGGSLMGPSPNSIETHSVPYVVSIPGITGSISLKNDLEFLLSGDSRKNVIITILDTSGAVAGNYKDTITLEVEPNS